MSEQPPTVPGSGGSSTARAGAEEAKKSQNNKCEDQPLPLESGPGLMRALAYSKHKKPPKVQLVSLPPNPANGQLLLRVHAASLNPADYKSADGGQGALLRFRWPRCIGFDFCGIVEKVGSSTSKFETGDRVFGMLKGLPQANTGTVAEFSLDEESVCAKCPDGFDAAQCAALPLTSITVLLAFEKAGLEEPSTDAPAVADNGGPRFLILGGAGGVGVAAIQIAKNVYGASFIATTASPGDKTTLCEKLGATQVINYRKERFEILLKDEEGFDCILDCTGEAKKCPPLLRQGGQLVSIAACATVQAVREWIAGAGISPKDVKLGMHSFLHTGFGGGVMDLATGARALRSKCKGRFHHVIGRGNGELMARIAGYMQAHQLQPVLDPRGQFLLSEAEAALEYIRQGHAAGKVVVTMSGTMSEPPPASKAP